MWKIRWCARQANDCRECDRNKSERVRKCIKQIPKDPHVSVEITTERWERKRPQIWVQPFKNITVNQVCFIRHTRHTNRCLTESDTGPFSHVTVTASLQQQHILVYCLFIWVKGGEAVPEQGGKMSHWNFKGVQPWCNWMQRSAKLQQLGLKKQVFEVTATNSGLTLWPGTAGCHYLW